MIWFPLQRTTMKNIAVAVLVLFATSILLGGLVPGCAMSARAGSAEREIAQSDMPSCCGVQAACMGGSCSMGVHKAGCDADHGSIAVVQKHEAAGDHTKALAPAVIIPASPLIVTVRDGPSHRHPRVHQRPAGIVRYADMFARTSRLLI